MENYSGDYAGVRRRVMDEDNELETDYPCNSCARADSCDGWEAQYCCTLCLYYNDNPDCDNCDPMDI